MAEDSRQRRFQCEQKLEELIQGWACWDTLNSRLLTSEDAFSFMEEFCDVLSHHSQLHGKSAQPGQRTALRSPKYLRAIHQQIECIGWSFVDSFSSDLSLLTFSVIDGKSRTHMISFRFPNDFPDSPALCSADLPLIPEHPEHHSQTLGNPSNNSIASVFNDILSAIRHFQSFWDELDTFDKRCWVLEPEHPTRSCRYRRIAIARHVSLRVEVNPQSPREQPSLQFFGAEDAVAPLEERLAASFSPLSNSNDNWSTEKSVFENLEYILGLSLPSQNSVHDDFAIECSICYSFQLQTDTLDKQGGEILIPDVVCSFQSCGKSFHQPCLYEWIKSLPSCRLSFDTVFGQCPYCSHQIAASRP